MKLALLSSASSQAADRNLAALARLMGIPVSVFDVTSDSDGRGVLDAALAGGHRRVAASSQTIKLIGRQAERASRSLRNTGSDAALFAGFEFALLYGLADNAADEVLIANLTGGALRGPVGLRESGGQYSISAHTGPYSVSRQMAGLSFAATGADEILAFDRADASTDLAALISVRNHPFLAVTHRQGCEFFLLSSGDILDPAMKLAGKGPPPEIYPSLLPALFFLRRAFGDYCWHNPNPHAALIIDDPTLKPRYGFLSYERLLREMELHNFATTIAFIPWNYRRTSPRTAALFRAHHQRLSICIHGCDHTAREFATENEAVLEYKAATALKRARQHGQITGIACDPVMVFPQGLFSVPALGALKAQRYLAAVNSTPFPDGPCNDRLTVGDLLDIAVTTYHGFPLFIRRYPTDIFPFALDLFLGKPALIVEHHGYFREGYRRVSAFIDRINALEPSLAWGPLSRTLGESALYRTLGPARIAAKFYSDRFVVGNTREERIVYRLSRCLGGPDSFAGVLCNGAPIDHQTNNGMVEFELELDPGATAGVEIVDANSRHEPRVERALSYDVKVAARRFLSEFRDNYIARSQWLLALSRRIKAPTG